MAIVVLLGLIANYYDNSGAKAEDLRCIMSSKLTNQNDIPENTIYLRRIPIEEALVKLEKYLDKVFVLGLGRIRVVHGKGTGQMKLAVRELLTDHPLVKSYREGYIGEGDAGVTVVEMEDRWERSEAKE